MDYPQDQIESLKRYCDKLSALSEGGVTFFHLNGLRLPPGCTPSKCNALLCPVPREGYPSRLYLSEQVTCPFHRDWKVSDARIAESNWHVFSWKVEPTPPDLAQLLVAHLNGFTKEK